MDFSTRAKEIAGESIFNNIELMKLFKTEAEIKALNDIIEILKKDTDANTRIANIMELGKDGARVLTKIAKYALVP